MEPKQEKSKTRLIVGLAIAIGILVILAGALFAIMAISNSANNTQATSDSTAEVKSDKKVTQQTLNQQRAEVDESLKQSQTDHDAAKKTVNDLTKQTKVAQ